MKNIAPAVLLWTLGLSSSAEAEAIYDWGLSIGTLIMLLVLGAVVAGIVALLRWLSACRGGSNRES